jgi:hypothetical protein
MKIKAFAATLALFLLSFAAPQLVSAQTAGQAASGTYQFSLEDGYTKYIEFSAKTQSDGSAAGQMLLSDEATLYDQDLDGAGAPAEKYAGFYIKADLDGLVVDKNQAVMSGTVRDSSVRSLIGLRVLLTVEDNGDNSRVPDKLTWGLYQPAESNWTPSDAELKEDPGVGLSWEATDAERKDDQGIKMPGDTAITVRSFPVETYAFVDAARGTGDILVEP